MAEKQGKVTIYDVAALAGVSVSSVSRVLHQVPNVRADVRDRVEKAIQVLEYVPNRTAQMLKTHRSYMLAHIVADVTQPQYVQLHRRLRAEAEQRGYQMILFDADKDSRRVDRFLRENVDRADGVICSARNINEEVTDALKNCGVPVVFTHNCEQQQFDACYPDPAQGPQLSLEHLLALGHRRIAFVATAEDEKLNAAHLAAYRETLENAGIAVDEALIRCADDLMTCGYRSGISLAALENPPTAIYTANDIVAVGVIQAMRDLHWDVPGKMSVTGEGDSSIGRDMTPAMTTVSDPAEGICETVIDYLLDRVEGRYDGPARIAKLREQKLIVRGSTGCAK